MIPPKWLTADYKVTEEQFEILQEMANVAPELDDYTRMLSVFKGN